MKRYIEKKSSALTVKPLVRSSTSEREKRWEDSSIIPGIIRGGMPAMTEPYTYHNNNRWKWERKYNKNGSTERNAE